ncbi:MAG: DUF1697 domain-containing protein [Rhodocyclales bacterium]|nr:DUF1697 domain-containing protein [Rhodocyclales bacterium]
MKPYAIFLRGVTPTGRNRVPMAELRVALAKAGLIDVQTHIQSGNVIARSALDAAATEQLVHEVIARDIGADIAVMARTPRQLADILAGIPFPAADTSKLYFSMLSARPAPKPLQALLATDFAPDRVAVVGDTIYSLYATRYSDSKFNNNFFERKLKVAATTRNFNTMSRLMELGEAHRDG